jgi:hypothetical protein
MKRSLCSIIGVAIILALCSVVTSAYSDTQVDLIAGQNTVVGTVTVMGGVNDLTVTYVVDPPWVITQTHLHVAPSVDEIPQNKNGSPRLGHFDYSRNYFPPVTQDTFAVNPIELETDGDICIAAHAVVCTGEEGDQPIDVDAIFGDLRVEARANLYQIDVQRGVLCPDGNPVSTQVVEILDGPFAGNYDGWCIEYGVRPADTRESGPIDVTFYRDSSMPNIDVIDCLFNNIEEYLMDYCVWHIQWVIWRQIGQADLPEAQVRWAQMMDPGSGNSDDVDMILELEEIVEANAGCELRAGDLMAIVVDPGYDARGELQDVIIPVPIPGGSDCNTAWADGNNLPGSSWATYIDGYFAQSDEDSTSTQTPDEKSKPKKGKKSAPANNGSLSTLWGNLKEK